MKTIKNGLMAAVLGYSLSGCGAATLQELKDRDYPSEEITIDLGLNGTGFDSAKLILGPNEYTIKCDNQHSFNWSSYRNLGDGGELRWGNFSYFDSNGDGKLDGEEDYIIADGEYVAIDAHWDSKYSRLLEHLRQPEVHAIWRDRWR